MQHVRPQGLRLTGWRRVEKERASDKYKPGLLARDAGATLAFELDLAGYRSPRLELQHLASWRGVGRVGVTLLRRLLLREGAGGQRPLAAPAHEARDEHAPLVCGAACDGGVPRAPSSSASSTNCASPTRRGADDSPRSRVA